MLHTESQLHELFLTTPRSASTFHVVTETSIIDLSIIYDLWSE